MDTTQLATFGIIFALLFLGWGALMALSPKRFWNLAKVDWNADVVDIRDKHKRHLVRIAGWMIVCVSLGMLIGIILALVR